MEGTNLKTVIIDEDVRRTTLKFILTDCCLQTGDRGLDNSSQRLFINGHLDCDVWRYKSLRVRLSQIWCLCREIPGVGLEIGDRSKELKDVRKQDNSKELDKNQDELIFCSQ